MGCNIPMQSKAVQTADQQGQKGYPDVETPFTKSEPDTLPMLLFLQQGHRFFFFLILRPLTSTPQPHSPQRLTAPEPSQQFRIRDSNSPQSGHFFRGIRSTINSGPPMPP